MKRYHDDFRNEQKYVNTPLHREQKSGGFRCSHCREWVVINPMMGTSNRNHCPLCLWSRHVDIKTGDREATCRGGMEPIGLTLKHEGFGRMGELMVLHECRGCGKLSINRIARDDDEHELMCVFEQSLGISAERRSQLLRRDIDLIGDVQEVRRQLFGG
ncbi:MAG TPA: RNHCP domain-containing protein [Candidatus Saccharimonadales bacterium]|nr:RNHCP domain-containing protein [Candidatus Saccharimonadales bacterium]